MTNSPTKYIGKNISFYRNLSNLTQDKLSEMSGVSMDYLSEIERGKKIPSLKLLEKIAKSLNLEAYVFLQFNPITLYFRKQRKS